jgi:phosphoribosylamine--glycine ligase
MNVLLIGSGGREHAMAWKMAQSPLLTKLFIAPGNPGTALLGENIPVSALDLEGVVAAAREKEIDLIVVGPDDPLAAGIVDACQAAGFLTFGPVAAAAKIESSKSFAKSLMVEAGVPTAQAYTFDSAEAARAFVEQFQKAWVVKADGLALGKGVVVASDVAETLKAIDELSQLPGGHHLLLEELLVGVEISVLALCDGKTLLPLPPAQDHKRIGEGDTGPNTGGMGAITPSPRVSQATLDLIVRESMQPVIDLLAQRGIPFCGVLFAGMMLTEDGPRVIEFNARLGDPETQAILPLLEGDLLATFYACAKGELKPDMLTWDRNKHAACVVVAAPGYPGTPEKGAVIEGFEAATQSESLVFQAGTALKDGALVTSGGRVLGITGTGDSLEAALAQAYATIGLLSFPGMQVRRDIGLHAQGKQL